MSTDKTLGSPLIYSYLKKFQQDPSSRVFAPLAEAYRKAGLIEEAIEIAREGLRVHPTFASGRVALARALFDKKKYQEVLDELTPVVNEIPDNLVAQRLVAESSLMLGRVAQALASYKMLLYFVPQDQEVAQMVFELEKGAYEKGTLVLRKDPELKQGYQVKPSRLALAQDPDEQKRKWVRGIEILQDLLLRVERYRLTRSSLSDTSFPHVPSK